MYLLGIVCRTQNNTHWTPTDTNEDSAAVAVTLRYQRRCFDKFFYIQVLLGLNYHGLKLWILHF